MKIAIVLLNLVGPAANGALGLPPADTQRSSYQIVVDAINASGGVACRKLVPTFYEANPADQSGMQQVCRDVLSAQHFFVIDAGSYSVFPELVACFTTNHVPFLTTWTSAKLQEEAYPYLFTQSVDDVVYKNTAFALKQQGFFDAAKGFKKFGFIYRNCQPEFAAGFREWLHQAGLSDSQIVAYNLGCPPGLVPPSVLQQAVLTFRQEGVTHTSAVDTRADFRNFTIIAQQQGFRPKWGLPGPMVSEDYGTLQPDFDNIANAIGITGSRFGEGKTPGFPPSSGTQRCNAIFAAARQPPVYQQQAGFGGSSCDQLWMLKVAAEHAPSLQKGALAQGLHTAGSFEASYPWGPNDFRGSRITYGDESWRVAQFMPSCECWQVVDREWHPPFH